MSRQAVKTVVLAIAMIVVWNVWVYFDWKRSGASPDGVLGNAADIRGAAAGNPEPQLWKDIKMTSVKETSEGTFEPTFAKSVRAAEGERVVLPGVGFFLSSGLQEDENGNEEVSEFLLLPAAGGVAWCCGLTPIPNHEFSVLVDCGDEPFSPDNMDPKNPSFFVRVEGVLRLQKPNSINSLYTLEDVQINFIGMEDVIPPNVMNLCLEKPMLR
ncbi:MAG: hypothetical protein AAF802_13140 [Planctomycetota bacterium]